MEEKQMENIDPFFILTHLWQYLGVLSWKKWKTQNQIRKWTTPCDGYAFLAMLARNTYPDGFY